MFKLYLPNFIFNVATWKFEIVYVLHSNRIQMI